MRRLNPDIMRESYRVGVQFLMTELQTAFVFLDVADTTGRLDSRQRNIQNARTAYDVVLRLLPRVDVQPGERVDIELQLDRLRRRLIEAGSLQE